MGADVRSAVDRILAVAGLERDRHYRYARGRLYVGDRESANIVANVLGMWHGTEKTRTGIRYYWELDRVDEGGLRRALERAERLGRVVEFLRRRLGERGFREGEDYLFDYDRFPDTVILLVPAGMGSGEVAREIEDLLGIEGEYFVDTDEADEIMEELVSRGYDSEEAWEIAARESDYYKWDLSEVDPDRLSGRGGERGASPG